MRRSHVRVPLYIKRPVEGCLIAGRPSASSKSASEVYLPPTISCHRILPFPRVGSPSWTLFGAVGWPGWAARRERDHGRRSVRGQGQLPQHARSGLAHFVALVLQARDQRRHRRRRVLPELAQRLRSPDLHGRLSDSVRTVIKYEVVSIVSSAVHMPAQSTLKTEKLGLLLEVP